MKRSRQSGLTIIELLISITIVAVLSSVAIPAYRAHLDRARLNEAFNGLSVFRVGMEQSYNDAGNYGTGGACGVASPTAASFNFSCTIANSGQTFTATATGNGTNGIKGYTYTINEQGIRRTTAYPSGSVPANCWLTSKTGCL